MTTRWCEIQGPFDFLEAVAQLNRDNIRASGLVVEAMVREFFPGDGTMIGAVESYLKNPSLRNRRSLLSLKDNLSWLGENG